MAIVHRVLLAVALALLAPAAAAAQSPLLAELEVAVTQYHAEPMQLDRLRVELEREVKTDPHADNWIGLARVSFLWGDVRAATRDQKLEAYGRGREAGKRATELAPRNAAAHFWYATNTGRWGQTNGVVRSLFLLSTVREHLDLAIQLDPKLTGAYVVSGYVDYEVPGFLGGDLDRAEESFRTALKQLPAFTAARVGLARTLAKKGKAADARREAQAVLDEKSPENLADWTVKDTRDARQLLEALKGKS
jgi:tetratricopeptide (TPR) repeat protein